MPAIVRWSRRIVCTRRVSSALAERSSASGLNASGPSFASGPSSPAASTHQPALRCVPNSLTSTDGRSANRSRTTAAARLRRLRRRLDVDAAALREVHQQPAPVRRTSRPGTSPGGRPTRPSRPRAPRAAARTSSARRTAGCRRARTSRRAATSSSRSASAWTSGSSGTAPHPVERSAAAASRRSRRTRRSGRACVRCDTMHTRIQYSPRIMRARQEHPLRRVDPPRAARPARRRRRAREAERRRR